jgi:hypothetical protein
MIKEFEFFHGVVLSRLVHASPNQIEIKSYPTSSNSSYVLNNKIGLFVKYSTRRMSPWSFSFKKAHQEEILLMSKSMELVFILLVCNDDGIVCLNYDEFKLVLDEHFDESESIRIRRMHREKYSVVGTDGKLRVKIGESDFPKKLFNIVPLLRL